MCVPNSLAVSERAASVSLSERSVSSPDGLGGSGSGSTVAGGVATGGVVDVATSDLRSVESSVSFVTSGVGLLQSRRDRAPELSAVSFPTASAAFLQSYVGEAHRRVAPRVRGAVAAARSARTTSHPRIGLAVVLVVSLPRLHESFARCLFETLQELALVGWVLAKAKFALGFVLV